MTRHDGRMWKPIPRGHASLGRLALVVLGAVLGTAPRSAAQNFLPANNGADSILIFPWNPSGSGHNLFYRCFPKDILWPPLQGPGAGSKTGLDLDGFQLALAGRRHLLGSPLLFFTQDPSSTCILSAATGGGFPPNLGTITTSPNTLASFYFYTSVPCTTPFAWWFTFTGSAAFAGTASPPENLLFGWADPNNATTATSTYVVASSNEVASDRSWSYAIPVNAGLGLVQAAQNVEWANVFLLGESAVNPSRPSDLGGRGGYTPPAGTSIAFHTFDMAQAGLGTLGLVAVNVAFGGAAAAHSPGVVLFGQHSPLNVDALWSMLLGIPFTGGTYSPPHISGLIWNPNAGWTPGGEVTSPPLPLPPGTLGLGMGAAVISVNPAGSPLVRDASNGSEFVVK